ncbi:MAG TPA: efflux RND transporter periplasmic adaptor subunit [Myxococcota bacterium]|nr:efflux RND transporter periplasmic adaptor subunit [Myxococcota bacterium]
MSAGALVLLLALAAGAAGVALRDRLPLPAHRATAAPLPSVSLAPPSRDDDRVAALGRLQPKDGVRVIAGPAQPVAVVGELFVDEGDAVRTGQLIARLDDAELREAAVQRAEARVANAKAELERNRRLREGSVISISLHEKLKLEHDVAVADLRLARAELARVEVRSPFDGQVIDVHARAGERVGPEGILELGQTQAMYAVAEVYETEIGAVALGARAQVTSPALPRPLHGAVDRVAMRVRKQDVLGTDPAARTDARVVEVEVRLDDADAPLAAPLTHLQVEVAIEPAGD